MSRIDFLDRVFALVLVRTVSLVNPVAKDPARKDKNRPLRHYFRRKSKPGFHIMVLTLNFTELGFHRIRVLEVSKAPLVGSLGRADG